MPIIIKKNKKNTISHSQAVKYEFFANKTDQTGNSSLPDDPWRVYGDDEHVQNSWGAYAENDIDSENSDYDKDDSFSIGGAYGKRKRRGQNLPTARKTRSRFGPTPRRKSTQLTPSNSSSMLNSSVSMGFHSPYVEEIEPTTPIQMNQNQEILKPGNGQIVVFTCNICKSRYKSKAGLNYHMNSQHPHILMNSPGRGRASIIQNYFTQEIINDSDFVPNNNQTHGRKPASEKPNQTSQSVNLQIAPDDVKIMHQLQQRMSSQQQATQQRSDPVQSQNQSEALNQYNRIVNRIDCPTEEISYLASALEGSSGGVVIPTTKRPLDEIVMSTSEEPSLKKVKPSIKDQMITPSHPESSSKFCDFCSGTISLNKKTNQPENIIQCSDCSRCGHLSCLKFNNNMVISVGTYHWQCLECKTCWLCETSENDEEMLFCDDCDRGYHMYCLKPQLQSPPDGSWSCKLCLERFRSDAASQRPKPTPVKE